MVVPAAPLLHQDRQIQLRAVYSVPHIKHEVVGGRGCDYDGHGRHRHRHRRRVVAAPRTRLFRVALRLDHGREQRHQHYDSNRREDGGQGRRTACRGKRTHIVACKDKAAPIVPINSWLISWLNPCATVIPETLSAPTVTIPVQICVRPVRVGARQVLVVTVLA